MFETRDWCAEFPSVTRVESGYSLVLVEDGPGTATNYMTADLAGTCYSAIRNLLRPAVDAKLLQVTLVPNDIGMLSVRLMPWQNCGFISIDRSAISDLDISIVVQPKIVATNIFALLSLSGDPERFVQRHGAKLGETQNNSLLHLLAVAYGSALSQLIAKSGLRGLHDTKSERLPFRIRGRVDVSRYLREYSLGRPHIFPCTYPVHTIDNKINRLLLWALLAVQSACRKSGALPLGLERLDWAFSGVKASTIAPSVDTSIENLPNAFNDYTTTGSIQLAKMIAKNSALGSVVGSAKSTAISVPMYSVFEAAFARTVAGWTGLPLERIAQLRWQISASRQGNGSKGGTFIPDIVVPPSHGKLGLIADTKWKSGIDQGLENDLGKVFLRVQGIKLYNADIYQMLGYILAAQQLHGSPFIGIIVYPVADADEADLAPLQLRIGGDQQPLSLFLLPWEIGSKCFERLPKTWRIIESLRAIGQNNAINISASASPH